MSPTPRAALLVAALAVVALTLPLVVTAGAALALAAAVLVDALYARQTPQVTREAPEVLARGVPGPFRIALTEPRAGSIRIRQPLPPDLKLEPSAEAVGELRARLVARRRGRHELPAPATRSTGPLGLGAWRHRPGEAAEVLVYPDLPAARRLAADVRRGRFRDEGLRRLGPLGLGTEFESVRDYSPDDDVRQVNWRATARLGRPMSNQYRIERDRDVICVVDCGRLMAAPFADRTRLDSALDAAVAVAAVADVLGDRCGGIAFDAEVRRSLPPRRAGAIDLVHAFYDLEPRPVESDYELAFQRVGGAKRALVLVFTDLLEESAARPLVDALPVLARRHAVAVASAADSDLEAMLRTEPSGARDVYRAAIALDVLAARERVAAELSRAGAIVIEAGPQQLGAACVRAYLRAKSVARF